MHSSCQVILRESDRPHIKDDKKRENNMTKNVGEMMIYICIYRFSNPRKESTPCDGDGKRK